MAMIGVGSGVGRARGVPVTGGGATVSGAAAVSDGVTLPAIPFEGAVGEIDGVLVSAGVAVAVSMVGSGAAVGTDAVGDSDGVAVGVGGVGEGVAVSVGVAG